MFPGLGLDNFHNEVLRPKLSFSFPDLDIAVISRFCCCLVALVHIYLRKTPALS